MGRSGTGRWLCRWDRGKLEVKKIAGSGSQNCAGGRGAGGWVASGRGAGSKEWFGHAGSGEKLD